MKIIIKLSFMALSPFMVLVYLRNSFRNVDNIHANYQLEYTE